jgi:hypothetical protein
VGHERDMEGPHTRRAYWIKIWMPLSIRRPTHEKQIRTVTLPH